LWFIHSSILLVTGQWNRYNLTTKNALDKNVRKLCENKAEELDAHKLQVECCILKFYPQNMSRQVGGPPKSISRTSYSNDIIDWMALGVFRHWFSSALALNRNRVAADGGYWLYKKLAEGGNSYLSKQELKSFHERFPMSTRGEHVLEVHVDNLKAGIRPLVADLMRNQSQLDCERFPVDYLTCVKVDKDTAQEMWRDKKTDMLDWMTPNPTTAVTKGPKRVRESPVTTREASTTVNEQSYSDEIPSAKKSRYMASGIEQDSPGDINME
jgi:hypothetical protein